MLTLTTNKGKGTISRVILVVLAHPDDEQGVAGTCAVLREMGFEIIVIYATKGEAGLALDDDPEVRVEEAIAAWEVLGVSRENIFFGGFEDTRVPSGDEMIHFLEKFCRIIGEVFLAFIHSKNDRHQDHRSVAAAAQAAFRNLPRVFAYESPSKTPEFCGRFCIDISPAIRKKVLALKCHRSQIKQRRTYLKSRDIVSGNAANGSRVGVDYAEVFEIVDWILWDPLSVSWELPNELDGQVPCRIAEVLRKRLTGGKVTEHIWHRETIALGNIDDAQVGRSD